MSTEQERAMSTETDLPHIRCFQRGVSFMDFRGSGFRNAFVLSHDVNGEQDDFGGFVSEGGRKESSRTFFLNGDDTPYATYADFKGAYYARFPERVEANR